MRNVDYVYGGTDPEQVTRLADVATGTTYATFAYDAAGNQTSRCVGAIAPPTCTGELLEYVYDGKDQLRRVTKKVGGVLRGSEEYWYDAFGTRTAIVRRDHLGNRTELVTFTGDTEAHYDGAGAIQHVYSHVSLGTPVARITRSDNVTTSVEYQFHGIANSTIAAVSQGGTVNASFSYSPFGAIVEVTDTGGTSNGVEAHPRRHNDKFVDSTSGLAYYGVRYYDKILGGWTQADPLYRFAPDEGWAEPRRANLYSFSLNNPITYFDPDGRNPGTTGSTPTQTPQAPIPVPPSAEPTQSPKGTPARGTVVIPQQSPSSARSAGGWIGAAITAAMIVNSLTGGKLFEPVCLPAVCATGGDDSGDNGDTSKQEPEPPGTGSGSAEPAEKKEIERVPYMPKPRHWPGPWPPDFMDRPLPKAKIERQPWWRRWWDRVQIHPGLKMIVGAEQIEVPCAG